MNKKLTMLMILDGYGVNDNEKANAVKLANTPNLDMLFKTYPNTLISTSGIDVGLPEGQMGNSEVGHTNIGAGRIVYQELTRITKSISDGDFYNNTELLDSINNCKKNNSNMHIYGLLSDGGVHSHNTHLYAILEMCKKNDFENVYVHAFLDGRDTPPTTGEMYVNEVEQKINEKGRGKIATVIGRYYSMDRDNRWERVELAYNALVKGEGDKANSVPAAIENSYQTEVFDEFVKPTIICENGEILPRIKEKCNMCIFFCFSNS